MSPFQAGASDWLSPSEVARAAGVTPRTVQNWCDRGWLSCERLPSGHRRIPASAWDTFQPPDPREKQRELSNLLRDAKSPQEVIDLLLGS